MKYKTQNGWTKEKMIETVLCNFLGKSKSNGSSNTCLYRGLEGKKCAMGMFIPDELYDPDMDDGVSSEAFDVLKRYPKLRNYMPLDALGMNKLQQAHDSADIDEDCLNRIIDFIENEVE